MSLTHITNMVILVITNYRINQWRIKMEKTKRYTAKIELDIIDGANVEAIEASLDRVISEWHDKTSENQVGDHCRVGNFNKGE